MSTPRQARFLGQAMGWGSPYLTGEGSTRTVLKLLAWLLACLVAGTAFAALDEDDPLPPEQVFRLSARLEPEAARLDWDIADGYYLYRKKFKFTVKTAGVEAGQAEFPPGQTRHDEYFGDVEIYRGHLGVRLPLTRKDPSVGTVALEISVQGCADRGLCYPPHKQTLELPWPAAGPSAGPDQALEALGISSTAPELLPPDQAFRFFAEVRDAHTLRVNWQIADGYYLYREKFKFSLPESQGINLGQVAIPRGEPKHDEEFGEVEVFHRELAFDLPLVRGTAEAAVIALQAAFQGCADRGVCYPPMQKTVSLDLPAGDTQVAQAGACEIGPPTGFVEAGSQSEQCAIADSLSKDSIWLTAVSFLGMGLLLAFTPCIFPMIPILSGIIVGHGHALTTGRAFLLSLAYVLAAALAYTVFGVLAGLFGGNLQALLQEPKVIMAFSALFVWLALSMFGLFNLEMPQFIRVRAEGWSNRQRRGTLTGAAIMGFLSALIVGPCVAAPLAGALIYIGQTGDAMLGGLALFSLGLGMGIPLLALGASAGRLLPKAGIWMNSVKAVFGVGLLGVAVWLLERILPPATTLFLWALLLIIPAMYLGALDSLAPPVSGWRRLWKGVGIVMLAYGILLLIGVASNSTDPLQPLRGLHVAGARPASQSLAFRKVTSLNELKREMAAAESSGQWLMLDFYADWCVSCKEMERYTFTDAKVQEVLRDMVLIQADVTDNSAGNQALLKQFSLIGPPATLFFGPDREERKAFRVVGYMDAEQFLGHLRKVIR